MLDPDQGDALGVGRPECRMAGCSRKKYALYRADHLSNSPLGDFSLVTDQLIADSVRTVYEDTAATGRGPYFYLLRLLH